MARVKYNEISPQKIPSKITKGIRSSSNAWSRWNLNIASVPVTMYETVAAVTAEISRGSKEDMVKSIISTSKVNTSPAIGALKIPAMAPAAPQPTSSINVRCSILNTLPRLEPIAEPVSTIGASAPTDPPNPMVMALAIVDDQILCRLIRPCLREMAYRILVTPWLISSFTILRTNQPARKIPTTGYTKYK